jgi:quercetin dioxygenase-like cupin family protein
MQRRALFLLLTALLTAQAAPEVEITTEPHHHLVLSNDQVRVFNVEVPAHSETLMHWHRHDYVYIQLGAAEVVNAVKGKDPVTARLQDGQTAFLSGGFAHIARILSPQPYRNITVELLQDDKLRQAPSHWEESRGLDILHGGTKEILFVRDGVRVSEFELQPGGTIPLHHHSGPHLVVALTDYELRSDIAGKPPAITTMKQGQSTWVQGGYSHTLTNSGHHEAKFITLEFP